MTAAERAQLKELGKGAYIRLEMTRLGYWPPSEGAAEAAAEAEEKLKPLYAALLEVRRELRAANAEMSALTDVQEMLAEVRRRRIERVRAERARRAEEKARAAEARRTADAAWRKVALPHLGRGVSAGLNFAGGDARKVATAGLPALASAADIAAALGVAEPELAWLCYERPVAGVGHYHRFTIPKRKGGKRVLSAPKRRLRAAQRWVLERVLAPLEGTVHPAAAAFRKGRSIVDNAASHRSAGVVVKLDLKDFFPSLGVMRIKRLFERLGYNEGVATVLALLCTETPAVPVVFDGKKRYVAVGERAVPQGACTSPALTNLLARRLDARLSGAARSLGFAYTRYADDLTFSHPSGDAAVGALLALVREIVAGERLSVNEAKTQVLRPSDRQAVTGLVVNGAARPRVSREDLRRLRAALHACETRGIETVSAEQGRDVRAWASGYLAFVHMARPDVAEALHRKHPWL